MIIIIASFPFDLVVCNRQFNLEKIVENLNENCHNKQRRCFDEWNEDAVMNKREYCYSKRYGKYELCKSCEEILAQLIN